MRKTRVWITLTCCILTMAVLAWAQGRRAGLWEATTTMTFQQSPFPNGMGPGMGAPRTNQVCVTQAQVDKYNGAPPQQRGDCQVTNLVKTADGYTASVACSGHMTTTGTVEAHYTGDGHGTTKMHLVGSMQMGPNTKPIEMTSVTELAYKGADCGSVQPLTEK